MKLVITKRARQYGYIFWTEQQLEEMKVLLKGLSSVNVKFNNFEMGQKNIDWKYHRISLGYKFTRAMPQDALYYVLHFNDGVLEVQYTNEAN